MAEWVTSAVRSSGYWGIVLLMLLENVVPPVPSELIMPLAGFMAARGEMTFLGVVAAGTAGSVLGAVPLYYLGRAIGRDRLRGWTARHGHWLALEPRDLDRAEGWFARHGGAAVVLCRLVPGVRSLISIPAGVHRMPLALFLLYTTVGTGLWAALLALAGRLLGANYHRVSGWVGPVAYIVFAAIAVAFAWRVLKLRRRGRAARHAPAAGDATHGGDAVEP